MFPGASQGFGGNTRAGRRGSPGRAMPDDQAHRLDVQARLAAGGRALLARSTAR